MNKQRFARQQGFHNWSEMIAAAKEGIVAQRELGRERARHSGLIAAADRALREQERIIAERHELAEGWRELARFYVDQAVSAEQRRGACLALSRAYEKKADEVEGKTAS